MKKKNTTNIILILIFLVGLSLLLYPSLSEYWNSFHQSRAIASYVEEVENLDEDQYDEIWQAAIGYNEKLAKKDTFYYMSDESKMAYEQLLNVGNNGVMGYIDIPVIDCSLPVYHGTDEAVLQVAVGHLEWSSLPVGGSNTHCIVSGHRGLPSARLFTDLDQLVEGDIFMFRILDEVLTYEVDQIRIVLPDELDDLGVEPGQDLCTLVTCTPYGVNSHRLLVRGHRIENLPDRIPVTADAVQIEPILIAPMIAVPILLILMIWVLVSHRKGRKR
ncbi:MAG: class C sortase [Lachnospiraceae bacterium]|nr:class C sortase [Lachnospiraceae bacterium]